MNTQGFNHMIKYPVLGRKLPTSKEKKTAQYFKSEYGINTITEEDILRLKPGARFRLPYCEFYYEKASLAWFESLLDEIPEFDYSEYWSSVEKIEQVEAYIGGRFYLLEFVLSADIFIKKYPSADYDVPSSEEKIMQVAISNIFITDLELKHRCVYITKKMRDELEKYIESMVIK